MTNAEPRGPQPARTDRPGPSALRVLQAMEEVGASCTISVLHQLLGGHPNSIRAHLDNLVASGFVASTTTPAAGRGRPARAYSLTVAGTQVALEDHERGLHDALLNAVAETLTLQPDPGGAARTLGAVWGRQLGGQELLPALASQGFTPLATGGEILLRTCPMLDAATRYTGVVCAIHQGLIDALASEPQDLLPFAAPQGCLVRPRKDPSLTA